MDDSQEVQVFARFELLALPTPRYSFLQAAVPYLTEWWASTVPAAFLTAELHHRTKDILALVIILEDFAEAFIGDDFRKLVIL